MILSTLTSLSAHLRKQAKPKREQKPGANHEVHTHSAVQAKSHTQSDPGSAVELEEEEQDMQAGLTLAQERGEAIHTPQRLDEEDPAAALETLPDDPLSHIVTACGGEWLDGVPELDAVSALGSLCKELRKQLYRLLPLVYRRVHSLPATMERLTHGPWRVVLLYTGEPTATVVDEAWQGHVRSIDARGRTTLTPAVAKRVVPELLGAGCSLLDLKLEGLQLGIGSWTATFGEAAVCSTALLELQLDDCGLSGPLPELSLPALQILWMSNNQMSGGLEPLMRCTALQELDLSHNQLTGTLKPLKCCTALRGIDLTNNSIGGTLEPLQSFAPVLREVFLTNNKLSGSLEPLRGCTALQDIVLDSNLLTGGLQPLQSCTALQALYVRYNQLTGGLEPLRGCTALEKVFLTHNMLMGGLEPLRGCSALRELYLADNGLTGGLEALQLCPDLRMLHLYDNQLTGGLEPLRSCTALNELFLSNNHLAASEEDKAHFEEQCELSCI